MHLSSGFWCPIVKACPAVYELDDSAALSLLFQLLKAMFKHKGEVLISVLGSLSWTLGKHGAELCSG